MPIKSSAISVFFLLSLLPNKLVANPNKTETKLTFKVVNLEDSSGQVKCALFYNKKGFPDNQRKAAKIVDVKISKNGTATCSFVGVKSGYAAVSFLHDSNLNQKMDTNFFGIPSEGFAASSNAGSSLSPPSFKEAKFKIEKNKTMIQEISMNYVF